MLSSGLRSSTVGGEKGALIEVDGRVGSRRGMMRIMVIARKEVRIERMVGMSFLLSPEVVPSIRTMSWVAAMVQYKTKRDFGAVTGRQMATRRAAIPHDAAG